MQKYLIVAEVDKIQSFIFRSSRLREVVGASYLLEEFAEEFSKNIRQCFNITKCSILSSKGGSFRIVVDEEEKVDAIEKGLRQHFEQKIGGSITITHVKCDSDDTVIQDGNRALRRAKLEGSDPEPIWHSPYHAICASSGEEVAVAYERPGGFKDGSPRYPNEPARYMGQTTLQKGNEDAANNLLDNFIKKMKQTPEYKGKDVEKLSNPTDAHTYAQFDPRQYVAYMVSDGNNMGAIFNACKTNELPKLSDNIGKITSEALIHAVKKICVETHNKCQMQFPVLPLISGGDDLFMLMPAPWAVHVAMEFCRCYEHKMTKCINTQVAHFKKNNMQATTGAAVVICKASYPYRTAYQHAHELLDQAKHHAKEVNQSCLIADFVVGSDTVTNRRIKPQPHTFEEAKYLVCRRFALRGLPSRILHKIEKALSEEQDTSPIVERVRQLYPQLEYAAALQEALSDPSRLRELLKLWDFCYDMDKQRREYLTEAN